MKKIVGFGDTIPGYDVPVLNDREVRAAAGILFVFALTSFMNSWLLGNFRFTRIFVIAFLIDMSIRIFINPRFSPTMIAGRFAVRKQVPEWSGAPQKRFAWAVGWSLAAVMFYLIVLNSVVGPINIIVCATCLTLMFFESAFGICLACKIYNLFPGQQAQYCPGGVCEVFTPHPTQKVGIVEALVVTAFLVIVGSVGEKWFSADAPSVVNVPTSEGKCEPPDWAIAMGHGEIWKLHNNCK